MGEAIGPLTTSCPFRILRKQVGKGLLGLQKASMGSLLGVLPVFAALETAALHAPGLLQLLERNKVSVGESLDALAADHSKVLGCLTGVHRSALEASKLLDGKYCLTGGFGARKALDFTLFIIYIDRCVIYIICFYI